MFAERHQDANKYDLRSQGKGAAIKLSLGFQLSDFFRGVSQSLGIGEGEAGRPGRRGHSQEQALPPAGREVAMESGSEWRARGVVSSK